jgi:hypothetical protein
MALMLQELYMATLSTYRDVETHEPITFTVSLIAMRYSIFITQIMQAMSTSETTVYSNETTQHNIPESCHL